MNMQGSVERRIIPRGLGVSPGVFVGDTLVFNELFEDRYELRVFDLSSHSFLTEFFVDHAPDKLKLLERIRLVIDAETHARLPR